MKNKGGQLTIFIIVAILIIAFVAGYFVYKGSLKKENYSSNVQNIENSFLSCLADNVLTGVDVLETKGGYIELPAFDPGSSFMPFSSQLNFLGNDIPYWYYVSGNNIAKEQVPTKDLMQSQLESFIEKKVHSCVLNYSKNYEVVEGPAKADVIINDNNIEVNLDMDLNIRSSNETVVISKHHQVVDSNLGNLYNSAKSVYDYEQKNLFLEGYGIDNLMLYAPVDGVEVTCSPLHWNAEDIFNNLSKAIESNTLALRNSNKAGDYFGVDLPVSQEVHFLNSPKWPSSYEVLPGDGPLLLANPVGNQQGLGVLGFCYVPYHFVYNINYPVLVQISEAGETFQFPLAVVIQGNNPRKSLDASAVGSESFGLCENKNVPVKVNVYDLDSNPIDANLSYDCLGEVCDVGNSSSSENFPQCVNGFLVAKAKGFRQARQLFSSVNKSEVSIYLKKAYNLSVNLNVDGSIYNGEAVISFVSDDSSKTILYPSQKTVELSEGDYNIEVYIYENSTLKVGETKGEKCVDVNSGIPGFFGVTRKKCFDLKMPSQVISNALSGGGKGEYYFLDSDLSKSNGLNIGVESLPKPNSLDQLQSNYDLFENKEVNISL